MAKFTANKKISTRWRNNDFVGEAGSTHTFADPLYDEFLVDWAYQIEIGDITITETPTTGNIQMASLTVGNVVVTGSLTGVGAGINAIIGTSPISVSTSSNTSTISIDQTLVSAADATTTSTVRTYVKNSSGSTINKGQAVYVTGADGTNPTIGLACATSDAASSKTLGILSSTLTNNAFGYVIENGQLSGIDTSAATAGSSIWLGTTPGSIVFNAPPAEPNHSVYLGVVTKANPATGSILVKVQNGYELDELHDVSAGSPADGDIVQYKTSSSMWTNQTVAQAGIAAAVHTHSYQPVGTYITSVTGSAPIAASTTTAGVVTVSLTANYQTAGSYQPAGTYVTAVNGTAPITASTTTAGVVTVALTANYQTAGSYQAAGTYVTSVSGDSAISSSGTTAISLSHATTDGYHHVPATSTTNSGKFLKAGATAGSEAWNLISMSDVTTGNYVATLTAGTGVTLTNNSGNAASPTVAIGQAVATSSAVTFSTISSGNITSSAIISSANISSGRVDITPVANSTTGAAVTGLSIKTSAATATAANVSIVVTADAGSDAVRTTSMNNPTFSGANCTGFTAQVYRTNTTVTTVNWIAIGR